MILAMQQIPTAELIKDGLKQWITFSPWDRQHHQTPYSIAYRTANLLKSPLWHAIFPKRMVYGKHQVLQRIHERTVHIPDYIPYSFIHTFIWHPTVFRARHLQS